MQSSKANSAPLRLWHWLNALVITGSLLTVLLNSTLLKSNTNASLIQSQLAHSGVNVTPQQARGAAHAISDKIWTIHIYCGYTLAFLLLFRLLLEFFQVTDQKLINKIKSAHHSYHYVRQQSVNGRHQFWVKTLYAVFYLMLLTMVVTGLCLAFEDKFLQLKDVHAIREIHAFTMYLVLGFIFVHVAGVFLAERSDSPGIISDMVNGGKTEK